MRRCKTYPPGVGAKPHNRSFRWAANPSLLTYICFFVREKNMA